LSPLSIINYQSSIINSKKEAAMPLVKNTCENNISITDTTGALVTLEPGDEVNVYFFPGPGSDLEVVSDEPIWSRLISRIDIDFSDIDAEYQSDVPAFDGAVIDIDSDTEFIYMMKISDAVTVYRQSPDADPVLEDWTDEDPIVAIDAKKTINKLYLSGTGTVGVFQYREPIFAG
jgi:hypothetical protein